MFSGIVEAMAEVVAIRVDRQNKDSTLRSPFTEELKIDQSVSHNGVCLTVVAIDNTPGSVPLETAQLPRECLLLFGQEGPGITPEAAEGALMTCSIAQFGSTRSINAGVAAGIAMHTWIRQHGDLRHAW